MAQIIAMMGQLSQTQQQQQHSNRPVLFVIFSSGSGLNKLALIIIITY